MKITQFKLLNACIFIAIVLSTFASANEKSTNNLKSSQFAQTTNRGEINMSSNAEQEAVKTAVNNYLTGISRPEIARERIQAAFYSSTNLHSLDEDGNVKFQPRDSLIEMVLAGNVPPHKGEIMQIEVTNDMAFAKVHLDLPDRDFYDYLTLLKLNVGWRIVSKTYTTVMK
ncbi:nuclear transport factor 2 family protein [Agarilytica rhodophyticola]|uniref:nuclear transport factor 2 family protein n=1 Tax=Agarilytica rhodophyticola TaxID=1737490 RepID=UPI001C1F3AED|nr:nuclear transport factor 2 family protein [Agarilytica rhodophyticola]